MEAKIAESETLIAQKDEEIDGLKGLLQQVDERVESVKLGSAE